jgi:CDGSH-type Zn-finger protein
MIYCFDCKQYSDEALVGRTCPDTGHTPIICPKCYSDNFTEAKICNCGEPTYGDFCDKCYEKVADTLNDLKEELKLTDDDLEQIISNHFGW